MLAPEDRVRLKLLMRVSSGQHSRMVEPSRAMTQFARTINIPPCKHSTVNEAVVPRNCEVDLKYFDKLLGGWDFSEFCEPNHDHINLEWAHCDEVR